MNETIVTQTPAPAQESAEPHLLTRGCCDTCEAVFAAADAKQSWNDYSRGETEYADVLAAQSYAAYRAAVADGTLDSYEYAAVA